MESPVNMQGVVMGLFWFAAGIGTFIGVALPYLFENLYIWQDQTFINCDRLDLFFYILALFLFVYSCVFICIAKYSDLRLTNVIEVIAPKEVDTPPSVRRIGRRGPLNNDRPSFSSERTYSV